MDSSAWRWSRSGEDLQRRWRRVASTHDLQDLAEDRYASDAAGRQCSLLLACTGCGADSHRTQACDRLPVTALITYASCRVCLMAASIISPILAVFLILARPFPFLHQFQFRHENLSLLDLANWQVSKLLPRFSNPAWAFLQEDR